MKPRPFDYARPDTVEEAVAILAEHGDEARVLAGGQTLLAMLNLRVVEPAILLDITRIPELDAIRELDGAIEVGAAVTQSRLLAWPALAHKLPLLAAALPFVGHFQTRNKGTVRLHRACRSHSEIPLSLAVLEGEVVLRSRRGTRVLAAAEFQQGMLATARAGDELITAVRFPVMAGAAAFREVARRHGDFAIVAVAAVAESASRVRLGVAGMAERPAVRRVATDGPPASATRSSGSPGSSKATRTCMPRRACGATCCAGIAPVVIEEARRCAVSKHERARLSLTLNGRKLSGEAEPRMLLSDFLRHVLGATGTDVGCEHGVCGCCTVLIDGAAVRSCLTLAVQAEGRAVTTVESLAAPNGALNALQQAFQNNHALQCGSRTPAFSCRSPISLSAIPIRPKLRWWRCSAAISAAVPAMPASFPPCSKPRAAATRRHEERAMNKPQGKPDAPAKQVYRELVTIAGKNVVLAHDEPPVINAGVLENGDIFRMINIFRRSSRPPISTRRTARRCGSTPPTA